MRGSAGEPRLGDPRGVIEEPDASRLLAERLCPVPDGNSKPGRRAKSAVNWSTDNRAETAD